MIFISIYTYYFCVRISRRYYDTPFLTYVHKWSSWSHSEGSCSTLIPPNYQVRNNPSDLDKVFFECQITYPFSLAHKAWICYYSNKINPSKQCGRDNVMFFYHICFNKYEFMLNYLYSSRLAPILKIKPMPLKLP